MFNKKVCGRVGSVLAVAVLTCVGGSAKADILGAGAGAVFRMGPDGSFQEGCFPPCLCPIMQQQPVSGTMKLVYAGQIEGLWVYSVQDVNWRVDGVDPPRRITGSGVYRIGSPHPITVMEQRMELELQVDNEPAQKFDSDWVPHNNQNGIDISVSINGMYCWDRVIVIDGRRVPDSQIQRYSLDHGSTFQQGCFDPCDCLLEERRPMIGNFGLVPLSDNGLFQDFAVIDVAWLALHPFMDAGTPINGHGFYRVGGEVAVQQQMALELVVGDGPRTHFDSGWGAGGGGFPVVDVTMSMNNMVCYDRVLHVLAKPLDGQTCGGFAGIPCEDPGEFCKFPEGACCCDHFGTCTPYANACPAIWDPVCGCDGVTYGNECEADRAGVSVNHRGPCREPCGPNDPPCPSGMFCKLPVGACDASTSGGACTPIPNGCPDVWDPVCGCDGMTYSNECDADAAGVSLAHYGPCEEICGGIAGIPCDDGEFCKLPIGTCDISDQQGVCRPIPGACPEIWDPVCGCDGVTYGNECEADAAGAAIDHYGACQSPPCAATRVLRSPDATYCPNTAKRVRILLSPPSSAAAIAIEDVPPAGWTVGVVSDGGVYDAANGTVRWGPIFAPFPAEVWYEIMPANDTAGPKCFSGIISIDGANRPICGDECLEPCCPFMAADTPQPACGPCPMGTCSACSNGSCLNGAISLCEVIGYACAWLRGCHDDISGVTRAAYIWRNGECYCWNEGLGNWYPAGCDSSASVCCEPSAGEPASAGIDNDGGSAIASVTTAGLRAQRDAVTISIQLTPPQGASASAVELVLPKDWKVLSVGDGAHDVANGKVKWGPYFEAASRVVTVQVRPPSSRNATKTGRLGQPISATELRGVVSFDGLNRPLEFSR